MDNLIGAYDVEYPPATFQFLKTHFNSSQPLASLVTRKPHVVHDLSLMVLINSKLRLK